MKYLNPPLIPEIVLYDSDLSALAFKIYVIIAANAYNSGFEIGNTYLSKKLKVTLRGILKAEKMLLEKGYILKKIECNNKCILTIPALETEIKTNNLDYKVFRTNVLEALEQSKRYFAFTSEQIGLQGYKYNIEFIIKKDKKGNFRIYSNFINDFISAQDAAQAWRALWLNYKDDFDNFIRKLKHG